MCCAVFVVKLPFRMSMIYAMLLIIVSTSETNIITHFKVICAVIRCVRQRRSLFGFFEHNLIAISNVSDTSKLYPQKEK